jgi:hypothetical protein
MHGRVLTFCGTSFVDAPAALLPTLEALVTTCACLISVLLPLRLVMRKVREQTFVTQAYMFLKVMSIRHIKYFAHQVQTRRAIIVTLWQKLLSQHAQHAIKHAITDPALALHL